MGPFILNNPPPLMPFQGNSHQNIIPQQPAHNNPPVNSAQQSSNNNPHNSSPHHPVINTPKPSIFLQNPPAFMPKLGTRDFEDLLKETGGASANPGFNYSAHIAVTRSHAIPHSNKGTTPVLSQHVLPLCSAARSISSTCTAIAGAFSGPEVSLVNESATSCQLNR